MTEPVCLRWGDKPCAMLEPFEEAGQQYFRCRIFDIVRFRETLPETCEVFEWMGTPEAAAWRATVNAPEYQRDQIRKSRRLKLKIPFIKAWHSIWLSGLKILNMVYPGFAWIIIVRIERRRKTKAIKRI
ncbi:MAG: hypothetical protein KKF41_08690 [Actinobacteria bacterium]|nr:hypothetical protein [Actinomycetota bacterium]MBU1942918.1 hypothetical protein [Actinomycetota bacterium]MBU2687649.1 hypothetical protein [Actinomycetota bacterium]